MDIYVIVPAYNAERYLHDAVNSVLNQPYHCNVIIVNDGSTDNTAAICDELERSNSRVKVIHQNNSGVSSARNNGISYILNNSNATEGYIGFCDSDDLWKPEFLSKELIEHISETKYDIYGFEMVNCSEDAKRFSNPTKYVPQTLTGGKNSIWCLTTHFAANLYSISLLRHMNLHFYTDCKYCEDKYFKTKCCYKAKNIELIDQIMYIYRRNNSGVMSKTSSISAADYYLPIINGWLYLDNDLNSYCTNTENTIDVGHVLSNVYFLDMASTHCMRFGNFNNIRKIIQEHPHYPDFVAMRPMGKHDKNYKNKVLYFNHPIIYSIKYRLLGVGYAIGKKLIHLPMLNSIFDKRRYPHKICP